MTPPLSPGRNEISTDHIVVDSDLDSHAAPEMQVDHPDPSTDSVSQPPLRLLEDEHVHLQKSGLRLSDFEVRGTLG
jgi:protein kinase A